MVKEFVIDSGACESVFRKGVLPGQTSKYYNKPLYGVDGTKLKTEGSQVATVTVESDSGPINLSGEGALANISEEVLAVAKLNDGNSHVVFSPTEAYILANGGDLEQKGGKSREGEIDSISFGTTTAGSTAVRAAAVRHLLRF